MQETKFDSSFHSGDITDHIFLQLIGWQDFGSFHYCKNFAKHPFIQENSIHRWFYSGLLQVNFVKKITKSSKTHSGAIADPFMDRVR